MRRLKANSINQSHNKQQSTRIRVGHFLFDCCVYFMCILGDIDLQHTQNTVLSDLKMVEILAFVMAKAMRELECQLVGWLMSNQPTFDRSIDRSN